jgi:hypothetical protein
MVDAFAAVPEMLQIALLRNAYISGRISVADLLDRVLARIAEWNDPALWISRTSEIAVRNRGRELDAMAVRSRDGCASVARGRAIAGISTRWWCASPAERGAKKVDSPS